MPFPFLQRSHAYAARLLHQAGLTVSQIPAAVNVVRTTVETWFQREIASGNQQQALQVLKGQVKEKAPGFLFAQLKEMVLLRLILHLGIRSALASNIAVLLLPFVLKRVYEQVQKNESAANWWQEQTWKQHLPTSQKVKQKFQDIKNNLRPTRPEKDQTLFL